MRYMARWIGLLGLGVSLALPAAELQLYQQLTEPYVEVIIPLHWLPSAQTPPSPAVPNSAAAIESPAEVDCAVLARRLLQAQRGDEGTGYSAGTRQLRERRSLEAGYRHACGLR